MIVEQASQNNRNGETAADFFFKIFSTCAVKERRAYAYYWWDLLVMIEWLIWWSSISKKTIAKALDINDIIKTIMGMLAWWIQISQYIIKFDHLFTF